MALTRRDALKTAGAVAAGTMLAGSGAGAQEKAVKLGRLKQSVCRWCYQRIPLEEFLQSVAAMGLPAVDLLQPEEFEIAARHGLTVSTGYPGKGGGTIPDSINNPALHDQIYEAFKAGIPRAKAANVPNLITFFGNRKGMPDDQAIANSVACLNRIKPIAEEHGVVVVVELLNSKVNHPDYQCDHTWWGVEVCRRVNSPRVKLLYDIYHMQVMEGDVIATIRKNFQWIGHFHTAGVPGRHELDDTQELNYRPIAQAIVDLGFTGYFAHEYSPLKDPLASLEQAIRTCDV